MAAHRRADEPEVLAADGARSLDPSGGHVPAAGVPAHQPADEEGLLLLALPGRHRIGTALETRPEAVRPHAAGPARRGHPAAQPEVRAAGILRLRHRLDVG